MSPGETTTESVSGGDHTTADAAATHYATFDPTKPDLAVDIAKAVAAAGEESPIDIEPLASAIDPDALNALVGGGRTDTAGWTEITFEYHGYQITACSDGVLTLDPVDD